MHKEASEEGKTPPGKQHRAQREDGKVVWSLDDSEIVRDVYFRRLRALRAVLDINLFLPGRRFRVTVLRIFLYCIIFHIPD